MRFGRVGMSVTGLVRVARAPELGDAVDAPDHSSGPLRLPRGHRLLIRSEVLP